MKRALFTGMGVALVTPFNEDDSIDEVSLRNVVDYVVEYGADFLVLLGSTSEAATLLPEERQRVMKIVLEQNRKRVPVMVGIGGNHTANVVECIAGFPYLSECDAILSVVPYYNKPSQEGIYRHFKMISESAPLPVFLYNVPGRTGVNMSEKTVIRLAIDCPNVIGIKEASGSLDVATEILREQPHGFTLLSGDDGLTLPLMSIGGQGVISVIGNALPEEFSGMVRMALAGDFKAAMPIHLALSEMCRALFAEGNPAGVKALLYAKGIIKHNKLRLPLTEVSPALYRKIKDLC